MPFLYLEAPVYMFVKASEILFQVPLRRFLRLGDALILRGTPAFW